VSENHLATDEGGHLQPELASAIAPVLRDVAATSGVELDVRDEPWGYDAGPSAMVWEPSGSGTGISLCDWDPAADRIASLADQVQEVVIEALWHAGRPVTWPQCSFHPDSHPLEAIVVQSQAVWRCPKSSQGVVEIGALGRH
jgi:hypothetical protein